MQSSEEILRRLTIGDRTLIAALAAPGGERPRAAHLDERTESLIRVAVLVPLDAPQSSYQAAVEAAMRTGASIEDLLATLVATTEAVGVPRVVSAAPRIAPAAGYDVDAAIEQVASREGQPPTRPGSSASGTSHPGLRGHESSPLGRAARASRSMVYVPRSHPAREERPRQRSPARLGVPTRGPAVVTQLPAPSGPRFPSWRRSSAARFPSRDGGPAAADRPVAGRSATARRLDHRSGGIRQDHAACRLGGASAAGCRVVDAGRVRQCAQRIPHLPGEALERVVPIDPSIGAALAAPGTRILATAVPRLASELHR